MKKSMTLTIAALMFAIALATTPHSAFAASSGKHIKKITLEMMRSSSTPTQTGWWSAVLSFFGL